MSKNSSSLVGLPFAFVDAVQIPAQASGSAIPAKESLRIANRIIDGAPVRYDDVPSEEIYPPLQYDVGLLYDIPPINSSVETFVKIGNSLILPSGNPVYSADISGHKLALTRISSEYGGYGFHKNPANNRIFGAVSNTARRLVYSDDGGITWPSAGWTVNQYCDEIFTRNNKLLRMSRGNVTYNEVLLAEAPWTSDGAFTITGGGSVRDTWSDSSGDYILVHQGTASRIVHFAANGSVTVGASWALTGGARAYASTLCRSEFGGFLVATDFGQVYSGPTINGPWSNLGQKFGGDNPGHLVRFAGKWVAIIDPSSGMAGDIYLSDDAINWTKSPVSLFKSGAVAFDIMEPLIDSGTLYIMSKSGELYTTQDLISWVGVSPANSELLAGFDLAGDLLLGSWDLAGSGYMLISDGPTFSGNSDSLNLLATVSTARLGTVASIKDAENNDILLFSDGSTAAHAIYRSADGGATWDIATLTGVSVGPSGGGFLQQSDGSIIAFVQNSTTGTFPIISTDYGASWSAVGPSTPSINQSTSRLCQAVQINDNDILFCGHDNKTICRYEVNTQGIYRYNNAALPSSTFVGLAYGNGMALAVLRSDGSVWRSTDRGTSWAQVGTLGSQLTGDGIATSDFYSSVLAFDGEFFIAVCKNGIYRSGDGAVWETLYLDVSPDAGDKNYFTFATRTRQGVFCGGLQALVLVS